MIMTNEFRTGVTIEYEGNIYVVLEFQHVKTAKATAFIRTRLRNLRTGSITVKTFDSGVNMNTANIERPKMQYLYASGDMHVFMNNETYEQIELHKSQLENELPYMTEGMNINIITYDQEILGVELPDKVVLEVVETAGSSRGNTASNATKEAICNTGLKILVPLFIEQGEKITVSTVTGKYDTRYKE